MCLLGKITSWPPYVGSAVFFEIVLFHEIPVWRSLLNALLFAFCRPEPVPTGSNEGHILDPLCDTDEERN